MTDQPSPEKVINLAPTSGTDVNERPQEDVTEGGDIISDSQFMHDVEQLKALRSFLIQQAVSAKSEGPMYFGKLNTLRWGPMGRYPNDEEWRLLEEHTSELYSDLDDGVRRRFLYGQIPGWVTRTAILLGIVALVALVAAVGVVGVLVSNEGKEAMALPLYVLSIYMIWLAALGAIGSISFIGMNALAVQTDVTFDLTNARLIVMRIVLGALFGIVLTLPFGFLSFRQFLLDLQKGGSAISSGIALQSVLLLLPFILGFSTSLVIMILNQFVEAVQVFFGKKTSESTAQRLQSKAIARTKPKPHAAAVVIGQSH